MKIEKINDNQIKCTLNKSDLASRQIKLSELAYGTAKAKDLFRDMMQQANEEFGFDAEDIPLMIEAIPISSDCIVLLITKVEDPEELDTRFSRFAPSEEEMDDMDSIEDDSVSSAGDLIEMLNEMKKKVASAADSFVPLPEAIAPKNNIKEADTPKKSDKHVKYLSSLPLFKIFSFDSLVSVINVAVYLKNSYNAQNSLYKSPKDDRYFLIIHKGPTNMAKFSGICTILSEHGKDEPSTHVHKAYIEEHFIKIIPKRAIQKLQSVSTGNVGGHNNDNN